MSAYVCLPGAEDDGVAEVGGRDGGAALCVQAVTVPAVSVLDDTHWNTHVNFSKLSTFWKFISNEGGLELA